MKRFLAQEAAGGLVLFFAAVTAMWWINSPLNYLHYQLIEKYHFFINDGLMTLFFLVVGLELRRRYQDEQHTRAQLLLPIITAACGMIVPAAIYIICNYGDPVALRGWATPMATDIAFAVGVLSLFGRRIPAGLRLFLLALAIYDDIGAILVIAFFYSQEISLVYLLVAAVLTAMLYLLNCCRVGMLPLYLLIGAGLWYALLCSGVHPTISGVLLALFLPENNQLEDQLHPWVTLLIIPLFALANAGFPLDGMIQQLDNTIVIGIVLGLFFGKQIGIFGSAWLLIRLRLAALPGKCSWRALYGVSLLCGIGFTMSLFLGTLSFQGDNVRLVDVRLGVLAGSILSGMIGALVLLGKEKPH